LPASFGSADGGTPSFHPALLGLLLAFVVASSCTSADRSAVGPARSGSGLVAWADEVCAALLPVSDAAAGPPHVKWSGEPELLAEQLSEYYDRLEAETGRAIPRIAAAGPAPVRDGRDVTRPLTDRLTELRSTFADAKVRADSLDTLDPLRFAAGLPAALAPLRELAPLRNPTADLRRSPELDQAIERAVTCRRIDGTPDR
jgi:hypothetical protein